MWVLTKLLTKNIPHTFVRNGYYYFSRRVPSDLRDHYSYHRVVQGLRTTSAQKAKVQASILIAVFVVLFEDTLHLPPGEVRPKACVQCLRSHSIRATQ